MKKVLIVAGVGLGVFVLYRIVHGVAAGVPLKPLVLNPTIAVSALAASAAAQRAANTGPGHF